MSMGVDLRDQFDDLLNEAIKDGMHDQFVKYVLDRIGYSAGSDKEVPSLNFGDKIFYTSPMNGKTTPCVFLREECGKIVVMFKNAEWAARVWPATVATRGEITEKQ